MNYYGQAAAKLGIPKTASVALAATDSAKDLVAARTNYTYYVQKMVYVPTTVAAQAITVRSGTTNTKYALIKASIADPYLVDFGEEGMAIDAGEKLEAVCTAGPAGQFRVEGYYRLSSAIAHTAANQ